MSGKKLLKLNNGFDSQRRKRVQTTILFKDLPTLEFVLQDDDDNKQRRGRRSKDLKAKNYLMKNILEADDEIAIEIDNSSGAMKKVKQRTNLSERLDRLTKKDENSGKKSEPKVYDRSINPLQIGLNRLPNESDADFEKRKKDDKDISTGRIKQIEAEIEKLCGFKYDMSDDYGYDDRYFEAFSILYALKGYKRVITMEKKVKVIKMIDQKKNLLTGLTSNATNFVPLGLSKDGQPKVLHGGDDGYIDLQLEVRRIRLDGDIITLDPTVSFFAKDGYANLLSPEAGEMLTQAIGLLTEQVDIDVSDLREMNLKKMMREEVECLRRLAFTVVKPFSLLSIEAFMFVTKLNSYIMDAGARDDPYNLTPLYDAFDDDEMSDGSHYSDFELQEDGSMTARYIDGDIDCVLTSRLVFMKNRISQAYQRADDIRSNGY